MTKWIICTCNTCEDKLQTKDEMEAVLFVKKHAKCTDNEIRWLTEV
jgi:hypothetical protein